jgi:tetratricopeptide (TPR) repeat protein
MRNATSLKLFKAFLRRSFATWLLRIGRFNKAREFFLKSLKVFPNDVRIHKGLSNASYGFNDTNEAIRRLEVAARVSPNDANVRNMLARLYHITGQQRQAELQAFKALCLNPDLNSPLLPSLLNASDHGNELLALHDELRGLSKVSTQNYGRYGFYQGFERLLLPGQRPIEDRLASYGLSTHLNRNMNALDIGCNCGFLALGIAPQVGHITGVDIDPQMVNIATIAARYLGLEDCTKFTTGKFESFEKEYNNKIGIFDLIIATAVHMHVKYRIEEFSMAVSKLLTSNGLVLLESQDMRTTDWDFLDKVKRFSGKTFKEIDRGTTMDENDIPRVHVLLRLSRQ